MTTVPDGWHQPGRRARRGKLRPRDGVDALAGLAGRNLTLIRFGTVGALTTTLDLVLFAGLTGPAGMAAMAANPVSYSCGIATSFVLNERWTFGRADRSVRSADARAGAVARRAFRFACANAFGLALSTVLVGLFALALQAELAKLVSVPIVFGWNYAASRLWVFR